MTGDDATSPAPKNADQAVSAVRWTLAGSIAQRLITLASLAIVARVVGETEYGAWRQLLSIHVITFVLLPLGFDQLYIREVRQRSRFLPMLAGALSLSAIVMSLVVLLGHSLIAQWLNLGPWSNMLWFFPLVIAIQARKLIYKTDLAARLDYRKISLGETLYSLVSGLGAVGLVTVWPVAWSLYIAYGFAELAEWIYLMRRSSIRFPAISESISQLFKHGRRWRSFCFYYCGTQALNSIGGSAPVIILAASVSKAAAAAFSMATFLVTVPIFVMISALHRVAFSALAGRTALQLRSPVLQMLGLSASFIVPVLIYVAVMAEPIVHILLGESWVASTAPIARLLSMYCIFVALFSPISSLDVLMDRPDYGLYWNIVATTIRLLAVILGLPYGLMAAVYAYAISSVILWLIWGVLLAHLLGAGQWTFHKAWLRLVPVWVLLALLLIGTLTLSANPWLSLVLSVIPAIMYTGLLVLLYRPLVEQGLRLVKLRAA